MILREAIATDAPAVARLYQTLVPHDRNMRVNPERISQIAADPNNFLLVVEEDGDVRATAFLTLCLDPMYGALPFAVLENVVVDPARQGGGYGRFIVEHIEAFCWRRGCTKIMLFSSAFRNAAHQFFSRLKYAHDKKIAFVKYRHKVYESTDPD